MELRPPRGSTFPVEGSETLKIQDVDTQRLQAEAEQIKQAYADLKAKNLNLNLTRGKPSAAQLDLANELLALPGEGDFQAKDGQDVRNYGGAKGIVDIRELWADLLGVDPELVIAADSSSLNIEFDLISDAFIWGTQDSERPWKDEPKLKWICTVPGYDRHFTITEHFGVEMVTVPMLDGGPDLDAIRELVKDPLVKGMWTVPMFANPTGNSFSAETVQALASMETAAPDFRIMWDNAYAVHVLDAEVSEFPEIADVVSIAERAGHPNRFWVLNSTSKITFAGSGVSFFHSSKVNLDWYLEHANVRGIGPNKVNQLAHAKFFGNAEGVRAHMRKHAEILGPKFRRVEEILRERLEGYGVATWTHPEGGYFISMDVVDGTASRVVALAKEAGIALTAAGSTFPLKRDPNDRNFRLAPSMPPMDELEEAMDGVATCTLLAALEQAQG